MARILLVTPAGPGSRKGNRVTADRWARILRSLGHRVHIAQELIAERCDILIALHARKSAQVIARFAQQRPGSPIVLALTGTDLYRDIHHSRLAQRSLDLATRLVLLQPEGKKELPRKFHERVRVIYQSAAPLPARPRRLSSVFEICVSGHLRAEKDPFRAAMAARRLPAESRIRITHVGGALSEKMKERALAEMERNPRYHWLGEVPRWQARRLLARSRLMVLSSRMEGGANVVSEALALRVPVLASRISGTVGMLGSDYSGYFTTGSSRQLAQLMYRAEFDPMFYQRLALQCRQRSALVKPAREKAVWRRLMEEL